MRMRPLMLSALVLAGSAHAQQPKPAGSDTIIVEGNRDRDRQVQQFVDALTQAPIGGQLSRFDSKVCPAVLGLPPSQARAIVERIRNVAAAAGMQVAPALCHSNAFVIVADDKNGFIQALYKKHPDFFHDPYGWPRHLQLEPGPVTAWQVQGTLDANGVPVAEAASQARPLGYQMLVSTDSSRLRTASRPYFKAGFVVLEMNALAGITTTQLADYAAMRLFTQSKPEEIKTLSSPTILKLLDTPIGGSAPITLTAWDLSFLKGLYSSEGRQYANRQRSQIRHEMKRDMAQGNGQDR